MPSQPIEACACNRRRSAVWKSKEKWTCTRLRSTNRVTIRWWIETIENLNDYCSTILQLKISSNPVTLMATEGNQLTSPEVARARAFRRNVETITPNFSPFAWGPVWLSCGRRPSWAPRFNGQLSKPAQRRRNWAPFRGLPPCRARSKLTSNAVAAVEKWRTFYTPGWCGGCPQFGSRFEGVQFWTCSA